MPSYVSKDGIWYPAKEHVVLPHLTGTDKEVYDGPDRAAEFELAQAFGVDADGKPKEVTFGINFRDDPDLIDRARQLGYKDVMEYAVSRGYDPVKSEKLFKEKAAEIIKHKDPVRAPEKLMIGGGIDTSGKGADLIGGFGDERERPAKELDK
jgi:hypothetical protein